jgi:hypothetical protein
MSKILVSTLVWAPLSQSPRAEVICKHLQCLSQVIVKDFVDILIIHNIEPEGIHPSVITEIDHLVSMGAKVIEYNPQVGWARGRNRMIVEFINNPEYCRLAMTDCDQYFADGSWADKILEFDSKLPNLHAYMIRPDKYQVHKKGQIYDTLGEVYELDLYEEWLGTTNVIDRLTATTVGGYDCIDFPNFWGFHDPQYGRRLRKSGLLVSTNGWYCDPIRIDGDHLDCAEYQEYLGPMKGQSMQYMSVYNSDVYFIESGRKPVWFDPSL